MRIGGRGWPDPAGDRSGAGGVSRGACRGRAHGRIGAARRGDQAAGD
ncbi:hypothetical protein X989_2753 [Burkholderia pseudomallei MSHR4378]|nr:hypothetical protein X989_2753 [Burkholderia pseudomallei MSHR4378]